MAFDAMPDGDPWGVWCCRCQRPIGKDEAVEDVRFEVDPERRLTELNGRYHAACAQPYLSLARALNMLSRPFG